MRVTWRYSCDFGHDWSFFRDEAAEERPEDATCPHGHPAVTLAKNRPADLFRVLLRPTAVVDEVTQKVFGDGLYRIVLVNRDDVEERTSQQAYAVVGGGEDF